MLIHWAQSAVHRVVDGRVVDQWVNADRLGMLQQIGVVPARDRGKPRCRGPGRCGRLTARAAGRTMRDHGNRSRDRTSGGSFRSPTTPAVLGMGGASAARSAQMVLSKFVGASVRRKEDPRLITGSST